MPRRKMNGKTNGIGKIITEHPIVVFLGLVATCIAIFAFITGKYSIPDIFAGLSPAPVPTYDSLPKTLNTLGTQSATILTQLASTSIPQSSAPAFGEDLQKSATAIAEQIISIQMTQTAIVTMPAFIKSKINSDFPSPSINVRSYPGLPDDNSNIIGSVKPGDNIIVTGWTKAPWIWYQIDVPSRNITGAWISGKISISGKVYDSVIIEGNIHLPPTALFISITGTPIP